MLVMHKLAQTALDNSVLAHDDILFCAGDVASAAYFVQSGHLLLGSN